MSEKSSSSSLFVTTDKVSSNRRTVVVGQEIVRTKINDDSGCKSDDGKISSTSCAAEMPSYSDVTHLESLNSSMNSDSSSFLHSYMDDLQIATLGENLIDDLGAEIEQTSAQYAEFVRDTREIPIFKERIEGLEKEKRSAMEDIVARDCIIETLKEHLSVLHEQNSQLAQLAHVSGGQSETLRIRNALVASLAQLKKLQIQTDEIPMLRRQISDLIDENQTIKKKEKEIYNHFSIAFTDDIEPLTYIQLMEGNMQLKSQHTELSRKALQMADQIKELSKLVDNLKNRIDDYGKSRSSERFTSYIAKLEGEKEALITELTKVKLNQSISSKTEVDLAVLEREIVFLKKRNSSLERKLQSMAMGFTDHTETMVSKLFDIHLSGIHVLKSEIQKSLSDFDISRDVSLTSLEFVRSDGRISSVKLFPLFQTQVSKLHQLRYCNRHLKSACCMLKSRSNKPVTNLQNEVVQDLITPVIILEDNVHKAHSKITELENASTSSNEPNVAQLLKDNASLLSQFDFFTDKLKAMSTIEVELSEERKLHDVCAKKYKKAKDKKKSIEGKLREMSIRFHEVASELSNSTTLLQKYQIQCESLQHDSDRLKTDYERLMNNYRSLQTQHESFKCESESAKSISDSRDKIEVEMTMACVISDVSESMSFVQMSKHETDLITNLLAHFQTFVENMQDRIKKTSEDPFHDEKMLLHLKELEEALKQLSLVNKLILGKYDEEKLTLKNEQKAIVKELECVKKENEGVRLNVSDSIKTQRDSKQTIQDLQTKMQVFQDEFKKYQEEKENLISMSRGLNLQVDNLNKALILQKEIFTQVKKENDNLLIALAEKVSNMEHLQESIKHLKQSLEDEKGKKMEVLDEKNELVFLGNTCTESLEVRILQLENTLERYKNIISDHQQEKKMQDQELCQPSMAQNVLSQSTQTSFETNNQCPGKLEEDKAEDQSLCDYNLQLEEQVSVLSQWNDKQCEELELLGSQLHCISIEYDTLLAELKDKEAIIQQNINLQLELKEVEEELNILRSMASTDIQEELHIKVDTQAHLLMSLNESNSSLHKQVQELQSEIKEFKRSSSMDSTSSSYIRAVTTCRYSFNDLQRENSEYKERIHVLEAGLLRLRGISASLRRRIFPLMAYVSVPTGCFHEDLLNRIPDDMLQTCSLLSKHLNLSVSMEAPNAVSWIEVISSIWFGSMSQKGITAAIAQKYITTISKFSLRLLNFIINLQDETGNTILHYVAATLNFPVLEIFMKICSCDPCITNRMGYNPLMVMSHSNQDIFEYKHIVEVLIDRTGLHVSNKDDVTCLMIAAASGNSSMVSLLLLKWDVNAKDKDGATALMYATQNGHILVVKQLIETMHCDILHKDSDGCTAMDIARAIENEEIISLLINYKP